jgi:hypothetical protein
MVSVHAWPKSYMIFLRYGEFHVLIICASSEWLYYTLQYFFNFLSLMLEPELLLCKYISLSRLLHFMYVLVNLFILGSPNVLESPCFVVVLDPLAFSWFMLTLGYYSLLIFRSLVDYSGIMLTIMTMEVLCGCLDLTIRWQGSFLLLHHLIAAFSIPMV